MAGKIHGEMAQMQELSKSFDKAGADVERLKSDVDSMVSNVIGSGWEGSAATKFRSLWDSEFKSALTKLNAALMDASKEVNNRKEALIQADS